MSGNTFQIREALPSDISTIAEFQVRMALETESLALDSATVLKGVRAVFEKSNSAAATCRYYIAEDPSNRAIVGCTLIQLEWSDWRNGTVWWIHSVYVRPEYRKGGTFRQIFDHLKALVDESPDLRGLRLYVDQSNSKAQQVYTRLGMNGDHYRVFEWMKT